MRITFRLLVAAGLLACGIHVLADGKSQPKPADAASPAEPPDLKAVSPDTPLSEAVGTLNDNLKTLYRFVSGRAAEEVAWGKTIGALNQQLWALEGADEALRKLGATETEEIVRESVLRSRAQGWVHGWATFSLATVAVSRSAADQRWRDDLLTLDRPSEKQSALATLLKVYSQIRSGEQNQADALRVRLRDGSLFLLEFAYRHPWKTGERPENIKHDRYIPSTPDLIGSPDDPPQPQRELLSLWALVNLQTDTWRAPPSGSDPLGIAPLASWLKRLEDDPDLMAFDQVAGGRHLAQSFKGRTDRMQRFLSVRAACAEETVLQGLVTELKNARFVGRAAVNVELAGKVRIRDLIEASQPIDGETLPQAEIWLRYVLLLSYQGEGTDVVADRVRAGGIDPFWKTTGLTKNYLLSPPPGDADTAVEFLRWGKWPRRGHLVRAANDATQAAYRYAHWEGRLREVERLRSQSYTDPAARRRYVDDLTGQVADLESVYATLLAPHIGTAPWVPGATGTLPEEKRLRDDLSALADQVSAATRIQKLALLAYRTGDPTSVAITWQGAGGADGVAQWDINTLPTRTFHDYAEAVNRAANGLEEELRKFHWQQELRDRYSARREQTEVLELDLAAAQLGLEIARQGQQIAETYKKIAQLGVEIGKLRLRADQLIQQAAGKTRESAELRLTLANQARDLAAAQVEALEQATAQAEQMVEQASESLRAMQRQLLDAADKIEEQKRKSGFLSIIKAVVNVVGAVLSPFTGGASLVVAQAATMAINIYDKVSAIDFKDLGQAASQLAGVVSEVGAFADLTVGKLGIGGEGAKQALADVKGWVKRAETDIERLGAKARPLLDGLKSLGQSQAGQFLSALASDIPVSVRGGKVTVDLGRAGIKFKDEALKRIWGQLLDQGGMMVNDVQARARLAKLHLLPDDQYADELRKAVDELIRVCPQAALVNANLQEATRQVEQRKAELKEFIGRADAEQRRFLGKLFDGWLVVRDAKGEVVAVERSLTKEAKDFQDRVEHYRQQVATGALGKIADDIRRRNADLERLAGEAAKEKNEGRLRQIARNQIPQEIEGLVAKLEELRHELASARGQLNDAETQVEIAARDKEAAQAMEEAAGLKVQASELELKKDLLEQTRSALEVRRAELQIRQEEYRLQAAARRVERSQAELRRLFAACRRWGVNPLDDRAEAPPRLSLNGVLAVFDPADPDRRPRGRLVLDRMAGDVVGMIQWVRLLNLAPQQYTGDKNRYALDQFTKVLELLGGAGEPREVGQSLNALAEELKETLDKELHIPPENLRFVRAVAIDPKLLHWVAAVDEPATDVFPEGNTACMTDPYFVWLQRNDERGFQKLRDQEMLQQLPRPLRRRALGYFRFRFSLDPRITLGGSPGFAGVAKAPSALDSFYFFLQESSLVRERPLGQPGLPIDDLRFFFVPSRFAEPNPGLPLPAPLDRAYTQQSEGKQLNDQLEEEQRLSEIRNRLRFWRGFRLTPAVGDWTVFLLESTDLAEAERLARVQQCRDKLVLTLRIPYLQVPAPARK
jgi:hypothetical protein